MYVNKETVAITVDASGDGTGYTGNINGRILSIGYNVDGSNPYLEPTSPTNGFDFDISTEVTEQDLWVETGITAAKTVAPRQATHSTVGVASLYASGGEPVEGYLFSADERVKIVVANAGNKTTGSFVILWG